jgi:hypothetical protein
MSKEIKEVKEITKFAQITDAMKSEWRERYPSARVVTCPVDSFEKDLDPEEWTETATFVIRMLERSEMKALEKYAAEKNTAKFNQVLEKNSILGGDMDMMDNDVVYKSLIRECVTLLAAGKAKVAKL